MKLKKEPNDSFEKCGKKHIYKGFCPENKMSKSNQDNKLRIAEF